MTNERHYPEGDDEPPAWSETFTPGRLPSTPRWPGAPIERSWAFGDGSGRGVRVAVVDSGIQPGVPGVGDVGEFIDIALNGSSADDLEYLAGTHEDRTGHGTASAGIIRSLAPETDLISIRVLDDQLKANALQFAAAIEWATKQQIDIVSMSLSSSNDDFYAAFHELADEAANANVMLVCAMNNERIATHPSEFASVLSVASHHEPDPECF